MLTRLADSTIGHATWENRLAFVALVMGDGIWPKFVARITERILLLLGTKHGVDLVNITEVQIASKLIVKHLRISGTICAADMSAVGAELGSRGEEGTALVTVPTHTLTGLLVDKILSATLRWDPELRCLSIIMTIIDGNRRVLFKFLGLGGSSLATCLFLGLGPLGRITRALLAADMLTVGTFLGYTESSVAKVAVASYSHSDRLLDTKGISFSGIPVTGVELKSESLTELLGALFVQLTSRNLSNTFGLRLGFRLLLRGFAKEMSAFVKPCARRRPGCSTEKTLVASMERNLPLLMRLGSNDGKPSGGALALLKYGLHSREKLANTLLLLLFSFLLGRSCGGGCGTHCADEVQVRLFRWYWLDKLEGARQKTSATVHTRALSKQKHAADYTVAGWVV